MDVRDALDAVCGKGSAERLVDSLYVELRGEWTTTPPGGTFAAGPIR
jgi:hypothetical protein